MAVKKKKEDLKQLAEKLTFKTKCLWDEMNDANREEAWELAGRYMNFLTRGKTERAAAQETATLLAARNFADMSAPGGLKAAGRSGGWIIHQGKLTGIFAPGAAGPADGFNIIAAHGDSPRLDLKPKCVYEETTSGFGMLKTNLYGGLKKFQWLARPLALWGFCALKDGRTADIVFGEEASDPVLTIPDLLPHLDRKAQRGKKIDEAIAAEKMNIPAASIPLGEPEDKDRLRLAVLKILHDRWGIVEEDMVSSELEIVPAGAARETGLDGSMIGGYGQDDRLSVFAALEALFSLKKKPPRPTLILIYDREEIGSYGSTGATGNFIEHLAARAFEAAGLEARWLAVHEALMKSNGLSADVEAAIDPDYKEVHEEINSARLGRGPCLVRYTGGAGKYGASEAGAEYMARVRAAFAREKVIWQSSLLGKQEEGGGGTEALHLAAYGMNIVDCGPPVLSMHSPFEISSKADLWMTVRAYAAFLKMESTFAE
ncbi:MAG: aminopeptidase [Candidatus Adiutrix sp.]|jgi:aspartyl aminopeptidase|nr:aminopeptidase [Candidatus Adiutrix sp.]